MSKPKPIGTVISDADICGPWLSRDVEASVSRYEQRDLEEIGLYRRLLRQRQSPCRCLECGGVTVQAWLFDENGRATHSPHGGCPGMGKLVEDPGGMRILLIDDADAYSPEGEYLGRLSNQAGSDQQTSQGI